MKPTARLLKPPLFFQERIDSCGLACLRMALAQQGLDVPNEATLVSHADMGGRIGIGMDSLSKLATDFGLYYHPIQLPPDELNLDTLKQLVNAGRWSLIAAITRVGIGGKMSNHAVLLLSVESDSVSFLDPLPAYADQCGEIRLSIEDFLRIYDYALVCGRP